MNLDWSKCPAIESDPLKHHGDWVFKGTRLPVALVLNCLADNASMDDLIDWYSANPEQVKEVLKFVAASLERSPVHADSL